MHREQTSEGLSGSMLLGLIRLTGASGILNITCNFGATRLRIREGNIPERLRFGRLWRKRVVETNAIGGDAVLTFEGGVRA